MSERHHRRARTAARARRTTTNATTAAIATVVLALLVAIGVAAAPPAGAGIDLPVDFGTQTVGFTSPPQQVTIPLRTTVEDVRPALLAAVEVLPLPPISWGPIELTADQVRQVALDTVTALDGSDVAAIRVDSVTVGGSDAADFSVTGCAGADGRTTPSCEVTATFTPLAEGPRTATVTATATVTQQPASLAPALTAALVKQGIAPLIASLMVAALVPTLAAQLGTLIDDNLDPVATLSGVGAPNPAATFRPITPYRALDTRTGPGPIGAVGPGGTVDLALAGAGTLPATATGVVLNVTATGPTAASYLTLYPTGSAPPQAANLLVAPGQTVPNAVTVGTGAGGAVTIFNQRGSVHVVVDVLGYFDPTPGGGDRFTGTTPARLLDSRQPGGHWGGTPLGANQVRTVTAQGAAGVPAEATAVVMNVTVTGGSVSSYLQVFPGGVDRPLTANLLFGRGQTVSNLVTVSVGAAGDVAFYNQKGTVHVVADVVGFYRPGTGGRFHALTPVRLVDSRAVAGPWGGVPLGPGASRSLTATVGAIPPGAGALVANLTATQATLATYLAVSPAPGPVPAPTASLLVPAGRTVPNAVYAGIGAGGAVDVFNQRGSVHAVLDAAGYFAET